MSARSGRHLLPERTEGVCAESELTVEVELVFGGALELDRERGVDVAVEGVHFQLAGEEGRDLQHEGDRFLEPDVADVGGRGQQEPRGGWSRWGGWCPSGPACVGVQRVQ